MDKIKIGHHNYAVLLNAKSLEYEGDIARGLCLPETKEILVSEKITNEGMQKEILMHEIVHGIFHEASVEQNEEHVERISKVMHGFLQDNINALSKMYSNK
ncbi:hypothetical protein J4760_04090 [Salinicoccus sp. ID82-1]|uniref:hypothetical protein n=1 Tax=Salinicoccus sp. ID82-1 TaxID=2820269 RepID=UPI001F371C9F|nr:hypothetical protein [Salinicoccus sp. ID82-1]MCG1009232.1 hypothetical protein [Salinicoccus sp. ID82-1]